MTGSDVREPRVTGADSAVARLGAILLGEQTLTETLRQIAELARETVPGVDEASITLVDGERPATVVFTGPVAVELDERQYESAKGPCLDAAVAGELIVVDTDSDDPVYTEFEDSARRVGIRHTIAVGLPVQGRLVGALNLYARAETAYEPSAIELAETFAGCAAVVVANAALQHRTADLAAHLRRALESRAVIEQAKGIVMARLHVDGDEAFKHLARMSQRSNRKLRDVAQDLVERTSRADGHMVRPAGS